MLKKIRHLSILMLLVAFCGNSLKAQNNCQGWIPMDTAFHIVQFTQSTGAPDYRNDDGSSPASIPLAFNFCFYGTNETHFWVNNNGNVTFSGANGVYSGSSFPLVTNGPNGHCDMLAPFWADVDTHNAASGLVWMKQTPTYVIVQWVGVGYFSAQANHLDSMQVIFSNGSDPIIPYGDNVSFCYGSMRWTTGGASGGIGGFDPPVYNPNNPASPATVGANKGDGINYIQFGRFGVPGTSYLGQFPPMPYNGIAWLDHRYFAFNVCYASGIPPIASGVSPCDTFVLCTSDTVDLKLSFLSIKSTDSVFAGLLPPVPTGVSIIYDSAGNTAEMGLHLNGNTAHLGYTTINVYAHDNDTPPDTTFVSFVLEVDSNAYGIVKGYKDTICAGDSAKLKLLNANTNDYVWSNNSTIDSIYVKPTVTTTYTVTLTKGKCSNVPITHTITVLTPPTLSITKDSICPGDSTTLTVSNGATFSWNTGASTSSIRMPIQHDTTFTVIAQNACIKDTLSKRVYLGPKPAITFTGSTDSVCYGLSTTITANGGISYLWNTGATSSSLSVSPVKDSVFAVVVTNAYCNADSSLEVKVNRVSGSLSVIPSSNSICLGDSAQLKGQGGLTYTWTPGNSTASSIWFKPSVAGNTTISLDIYNGHCHLDTSAVIKAFPPPVITVTHPGPICKGDSITLEGFGASTYKWSTHSTDSIIKVSPPINTTYTVVGTKGCVDSTTTTVTVDAPSFTVCCDATIAPGSSVNLSATGATSYVWAPITGLSCFNCANPVAAPPATTIYTITSTDANGCHSVDTMLVTVSVPCADFQVPSVFTPNNDGINDDLVINVLNPSAYNITIYDRWGRQVYTSPNPTAYWNGRLNGTDNLVPDGTYYYIIKSACGNNEYIKKGFVELLGEK